MRYVPTKVYSPILRGLIEDRFGYVSDEALYILEEKSGVPWDTTYNILAERRDGCDFNVADELLCALGQPQLWREDPLADIYFNIDLSKTVCANPGCTVEFHDPHYADLPPVNCVIEGCLNEPKARGLCNKHYIQVKRDGLLHTMPKFYQGRLTMYCSMACRQSAYQMAKGITTNRRKNYLKSRDKKCRNGHERTPENTRVRKNGKMECLLCARETNRKGYHRRRKQKVAA